MKQLSTFCYLLLLLTCISGRAQKFQYITYRGDEVPFKKVNQVLQDHLDYMWVASDQGLYRFDGTAFEDYNTTLKSRYIRSLISFNDSTLLFSNDTGLHLIRYEEDEVVIGPYLSAEEAESGMGYPGSVFLDSQNRLWIAQLDGSVFLQLPSEETPEAYVLKPGIRSPNMFFGEDRWQTIWVLIPGEGLYYFNQALKKFEQLELSFKVSHFLTEGDMLLLAGERLEQWTINEDHLPVNKEQISAEDNHFNFLTRDKAGTLFIASERGLYSLQPGSGQGLHPLYGSNDPHRVEVLPYKEVNQLYFSSDQRRSGGTLWVCMPDGLGLLFSSFFKTVSGLSNDNIFAMGKGLEGEVLISQGTVYSINTSGLEPDFSEVEGLSRITSVSANEDFVWFGSADGRLFRRNDNGNMTVTDFGKRGGGIFYTYTDQTGALWFCQAPTDNPIVGIAKVAPDGNIIFYDETKGLRNRILVAREGGRSELYVAGIGIDTYLYKYDRDSDTFVNHSQPFPFRVSRNFEVHDLAVDDNGLVWMATTDGLLKYDTENVYRIDLGDFTTQEIRAVCTLHDGSVWLATDTSGLIHLDTDGNHVLFDDKSGTPSKIASYRSLLLDNDTRLWVGTAEGAVFSALKNPAPLQSAKPRLKQIFVNGHPANSTGETEFSKEDLVEFSMVSVTFPGEETHYSYKYFENDISQEFVSDIPWSPASQNSRIQIKGLAGGTYHLRVKAQQSGGHAWSDVASFTFTIRRPWYAQGWGIGILILAGLLFFWYGIRLWVVRKVNQLETTLFSKEKELSEREAELQSQSNTIKEQQEALKSAGVTVYLLYRLIRQIPEDASWNTLLPLLAKLVELPTGLDAFELAFHQKDKLLYRGYLRGGKGEQQVREKDFDEKEDLASFTLSTKKPVLLKDYFREVAQYVLHADEQVYGSRIYLPFETREGEDMVFCAYAVDANKFEQSEMTMLQILISFLIRSLHKKNKP